MMFHEDILIYSSSTTGVYPSYTPTTKFPTYRPTTARPVVVTGTKYHSGSWIVKKINNHIHIVQSQQQGLLNHHTLVLLHTSLPISQGFTLPQHHYPSFLQHQQPQNQQLLIPIDQLSSLQYLQHSNPHCHGFLQPKKMKKLQLQDILFPHTLFLFFLNLILQQQHHQTFLLLR